MFLVDIGNSRIKWGVWTGGAFADTGSASCSARELEAVLDHHWLDLVAPKRLLVSNVTGVSIARRLTLWSEMHWGLAPEFASVSTYSYGIRNGYDDPQQLGVDRWLSMIAAWDRFRSAVCVVDCGTAVTIDALDAGGQHLGGFILAGLGLMRQSLSQRTHGLKGENAGQMQWLANNTQDAIAAGTLLAVTAPIERTVFDLRERLDTRVACILTGGDAPALRPVLSVETVFDPDLVLRGLATVAEKTP